MDGATAVHNLVAVVNVPDGTIVGVVNVVAANANVAVDNIAVADVVVANAIFAVANVVVAIAYVELKCSSCYCLCCS